MGTSDVYGDVIINKKPGAKSVILFFPGVGVIDGMPDTMVPILENLPAHNIQLADEKRMVGFAGFGKLGDSYEETISALKKLIAELGADQIITIGASAGGYTAARYGLALGASHIISVAGPTAFTPESLRNDKRILIVSTRILRRFPGLQEELADLIRNHKQPVRIDHFYGADMPEDSHHAARIEGLPGVHLHKLEGVGVHRILKPLIEDGTIEKYLRDAIESRQGQKQ
jgi:hypothetical protein